VPLKAEGRKPPLFGVPGHNGDVFCYVALARHLEADQPLLGVQPPGLDGTAPLRSIEELAAYEVEQIRRYRPRGPYLLAGYCAGGTIVFEVARQLTEARERVAFLGLIGSPFPMTYRRRYLLAMVPRYLRRRAQFHLSVLASGSVADGFRYVRSKIGQHADQRLAPTRELHPQLAESRRALERTTIEAIRHYRQRRYAGVIDLFIPSEAWRKDGGRPDLWRTMADGTREHVGPDDCPADEMLTEPHVRTMAEALRLRLGEISLSEEPVTVAAAARAAAVPSSTQ
jgi:thioesterase domain-containing protein